MSRKLAAVSKSKPCHHWERSEPGYRRDKDINRTKSFLIGRSKICLMQNEWTCGFHSDVVH